MKIGIGIGISQGSGATGPEARRNLLIETSNLAAAAWTKSFVAVVASGSTDGVGGTSAFSVTRNAVGDGNIYQTAAGVSAGQAATYSADLKAGATNFAVVQILNTGGGIYAYVNLLTGAVSQAAVSYGSTPPTGLVVSSVALLNGFFRFSASFTLTTASLACWIKPISLGTGAGSETANLGQSLLMARPQLELGAATAYQPVGATWP